MNKILIPIADIPGDERTQAGQKAINTIPLSRFDNRKLKVIPFTMGDNACNLVKRNRMDLMGAAYMYLKHHKPIFYFSAMYRRGGIAWAEYYHDGEWYVFDIQLDEFKICMRYFEYINDRINWEDVEKMKRLSVLYGYRMGKYFLNEIERQIQFQFLRNGEIEYLRLRVMAFKKYSLKYIPPETLPLP